MQEKTTNTLQSTTEHIPIRQEVVQANRHSSSGYSYGYAEQPEGDDSDRQGLVEYWRIVQRYKGTILIVAFLGLVIGLLVTLPQTPIYQAKLTLEIQDINQNFLNMKETAPVAESGNSALADIQTQLKIILSDTLLERAVEKMKTPKPVDSKVAQARVWSWRKTLNLPELAAPEAKELAVSTAKANTKARAAGATRIIEILSDSTDGQVAADFANTLANEYIEQNVEARWKMTQRTGDWLTRQLDDMRVKLERSEDALQRYARQTGLIFTGEKQNISEEKLRQLQTSLSAAQADRIGKQSKWEMTRSASPETLPDVLNDTSLKAAQDKLAELRRQEVDLSSTYKGEYSKVKRVKAQIVEIERSLVQERRSITERIRNEYEESINREKLLAADYGNQAKLVNMDAEKSIEYNILKREVDSNRQLYDSMLQKVKESSVSSAMRASNVRVIDPAKAPRLPYKPNLSTNAGIGGMIGLFLGVGFVIMRERADRTLQEPGDMAYYLNVPELGIIPSATSKAKLHMYYYGKKQLKASEKETEEEENVEGTGRDGQLALLESGQPKATERVELITVQRKASMVAESFRVVLTSLLFSGKNGIRPKTILMTSSGPAEGKTTVTCNLAIALAEIKKRTLLIDADLRKPRMHTIFNIDNEIGLSNLLSENITDAESILGLIKETTIPGLFLLPSGPSTQAAASLLYANSLQEIIRVANQNFDMVLIDTPPMLQMPDARVISRFVDGVVLVARAGHTTRDAAQAVRQRLAQDQTPILGTILNDWDPKNSSGGYYGYYKGGAYYKGGYGYGNSNGYNRE